MLDAENWQPPPPQKKKQAMGEEAWKALQRVRHMERVQAEQQTQLSWLEPHLAKSFPLQWLPLDWIGEGCMVAPLPHSTGMDYLDLLSSEL